MKLGTSQPGTMAPALVALLVLAGSAALAGTQEPVPTASPRAPAVSRVQTGRLGHQTDEVPPVTPNAPAAPTSGSVEPEGCGDAMNEGDAALERAHGLDRAMQAILDSCGRGPATDGLLNALEHLRENKARHAEHGNQGKSGEDHGKPSDDPGKSGEDHGKSGQDHGKGPDQQDEDDGGEPTSPPAGGNDVREGGGPPDDHGRGNR